MKHCGRRFHQEVGKFRFLNEIIKVISPKVGTFTYVHIPVLSTAIFMSGKMAMLIDDKL